MFASHMSNKNILQISRSIWSKINMANRDIFQMVHHRNRNIIQISGCRASLRGWFIRGQSNMAIDLSSLVQYYQHRLREMGCGMLEIDGILSRKYCHCSRTCRTLGSHRFILAHGKLKEII